MASFVSGGGGGSDIFVVEYGSTTFSELLSAINSNKTIVMDIGSTSSSKSYYPATFVHGDSLVIILEFYGYTTIGSSGSNEVTAFRVQVDNTDTWSLTQTNLADAFIVIYDTDTYDTVVTARDQGKLIFIDYDGALNTVVVSGSGTESNTPYLWFDCFEGIEGVGYRQFKLTYNNVWSNTFKSVAQISKIWTGTCSTATGTNEKVVTLDDSTGFSLAQDVKIAVTFYCGEENLDSIKLNVNSTGAKSVYAKYNLSNMSVSGVKWANNSTVFFTYVSNFWLFEGSALIQEQAYNTATEALPKSGGTMTGALTLSGAPTSNLHAATKKYVDDSIDNVDALPDQTGQSGKFLTTNGTAASWADAPKELFKCTYGTTTFDEIETVMNKKLPYLIKGYKCYIYSGGSYTDWQYHYFDNVSNGVLRRIVCDDMDNWSELTAITVVKKSGDTMTGALTLNGDPTDNLHAATKQYVDNSKEIFIATYGTTTYAEINTAYTAGKTIIVSRDFNGTTIYTLTDVGTSGTYHFRTFSSSGNIVYGCYIGTDGVWHVNSNTLATQSALETGLATKQKTITVSTEEPTSTDGVDGDIWFVYEE